MNKSLLICILLFLCLYNLTGYSQNTSESIHRHNYLGIAAGINNPSIRDKLNTSLPYSGLNPGSIFEYTASYQKSELQLKYIFSSGNLTPFKSDLNSKNSIENHYENINASFMLNVFDSESQKIYLFVGPDVMAKFGFRLNDGEIGNSGITYEGAASFGLSTKVEKYFSVLPLFKKDKFGNDFKLECSLKLPLISKVFTPPYLGFSENLLQEQSAIIDFGSNYTGFFSNYSNIELGLSLTYYLKNRNGIEFSYFYDYTSTRPKYNPSKTSNKFLSIKLLYRLN